MGSLMRVCCMIVCLYSSSSLGLIVQPNSLGDTSEDDVKVKMYNVTHSEPSVDIELAAEGNDKVVHKLVSILKDQDGRIKELEELSKKLLLKIDELEQQAKVNNVIFSNVQESKYENHRSSLRKVLQILNNKMRLRTKAEDISVALRVDSDNATEVRPIVVRFANFATKMRVLAAKNKLKYSKVDISSDYSELVSRRRKELLPFLLEKQAQGHVTFMLYDKLVVDGVKVSLEDLKAERDVKCEEENGKEKKPEVDQESEVSTTTKSTTTAERDEKFKEKNGKERKPEVDPELEVSINTESTTTEKQWDLWDEPEDYDDDFY